MRYDCEFILWNLVLVGLKWGKVQMQMIYFLSMSFDLDCVLEYLWNLKPKHTHTPLRSRLYLLNQNLQGWSSGIQTFLKCHRKRAPSTYKCWECKLVQSLEINLAVISFIGIFAIDTVVHV